MIKNLFLVLAQFVLFFVIFFVGSILPPFHLKWAISHPTPTITRFFVPDGLLLMVGFYVFFVVVEAVAKRLRTAGLWTSVAFALALIFGLASKFGWVTQSLF